MILHGLYELFLIGSGHLTDAGGNQSALTTVATVVVIVGAIYAFVQFAWKHRARENVGEQQRWEYFVGWMLSTSVIMTDQTATNDGTCRCLPLLEKRLRLPSASSGGRFLLWRL